jgi:WS/DGAT/MGAT family acyltransferase
MRFSERMSDHEALMWNVEKDPWLNPSGGSIAILDGEVDLDHFRRTMRAAIAKMSRLYERVVPGFGGFTPPAWVPDPEFDLDFHSRHLSLPSPGSERQLLDLAAQLYQEPFDRTRPLWRFVLIDGLEGGRSAIWSMMHHSISDGIGQLRMAEMYQQLSPDDPAPDEVDLEGIIAAAFEERSGKEEGGDLASGISTAAAKSLSHVIRRQAGLLRRAAGEVAIWPADPQRARDSVEQVVGAASSTVGSLTGSGNEVDGGSPLWKHRSRHRHLENVVVPLDGLKAASKKFGVSINDLFLAGMTEGALRYHADRDVEVDAFNTSYELSTRTDSAIGGNSFTPVPVQVPGTKM